MDELSDHTALTAELSAILASQWDPAVTMLEHCLREHHKVLLCGNGGSAAEASHIAAELVGRFYLDRKAYPAIALSSDPAIMTAVTNDYGYVYAFARQVEAYGEAGDVLIALSTSGRSRNVLEAIARAKQMGMRTLGISGSNQLQCDVDIAIPSTVTARIQELSLLCGHLIINGLEERLPK